MMSYGTVIDVAIGLILTFLLVGLLASGVQESVAGLLQLRGRELRRGLMRLLSGPTGAQQASALFDRFFSHSLICDADNKLPSYVPARNFSAALIEVLRYGGQAPLISQIEGSVNTLPDSPVKQALTALLVQAAGDLDAFRAKVETWFDDAMDRVSGTYKRWTHLYTFLIGLAVAVAFNVDTILIAKTLWLDPVKRAAVVAAAETYAKQEGGTQTDPAVQAEAARKQLESLPLPIGWVDAQRMAGSDVSNPLTVFWTYLARPDGIWALLGWLITGIAASMGAPFWFDTLQRFVRLRNAGPKPSRSQAET